MNGLLAKDSSDAAAVHPLRVRWDWFARSVLNFVLAILLTLVATWFLIYMCPDTQFCAGSTVLYIPRAQINSLWSVLVISPILVPLLKNMTNAVRGIDDRYLFSGWIATLALGGTTLCICLLGNWGIPPLLIFTYSGEEPPSLTVGNDIQKEGINHSGGGGFLVRKALVSHDTSVVATSRAGMQVGIRPDTDGQPFVCFCRHTRVDLDNLLDVRVRVNVNDDSRPVVERGNVDATMKNDYISVTVWEDLEGQCQLGGRSKLAALFDDEEDCTEIMMRTFEKVAIEHGLSGVRKDDPNDRIRYKGGCYTYLYTIDRNNELGQLDVQIVLWPCYNKYEEEITRAEWL